MSVTVAVADWIKRIADDERGRDLARVRADEVASQQADLISRHGRRIVDELRATVTRDLDAFRSEFPGDAARDIAVETTGADGGFVVRRPAPAAISLTVVPNLAAAALVCRYRFTLANGLPPREDRSDVMLVRDGGETLQMKDPGTGQVFHTADALSEYLLTPVLTARRR
jgi:hypothetical protein